MYEVEQFYHTTISAYKSKVGGGGGGGGGGRVNATVAAYTSNWKNIRPQFLLIT